MKRKLFLHRYENVRLVDPEFPRCRLYQTATATATVTATAMDPIHPYDECVMSMPDAVNEPQETTKLSEIAEPKFKSGTYFFFVFNLDNYFHFLYDALPYLSAHKEVVTLQISSSPPQTPCKILLPAGYTNKQFQRETFEMLGLEDFLEVADEQAIYETVFVSSSFTHGHLENGASASNTKPEPTAYDVWKALLSAAAPKEKCKTPKKIYISRRTWVHNKTENIGTNYTTRRRCTNEDALVESLTDQGYTEVFCELMTMPEKIQLFHQATHIVGFIGGGMTNCIFARPKTQVACLLTPDFIRINRRFKYTMEHTDVRLLNCCKLAPHKGPFSPFTRVQRHDGGLVGEVEAYEEGNCLVRWPEKIVAGFAFDGQYRLTWVPSADLKALDHGLNSPFECDIACLKRWCDETK